MSEEANPRVDELIERTQKFLANALTNSVEKPVRSMGKRLGMRFLRFQLAIVLLTGAAGFLLYGFMSMLTLWLPLFGACLIAGGVALLLGLIFLRV
jgi:hypothetical protein